MTVASMLAYACATVFGLPEGYWAVITCLVVVQANLGGTLEAGMSRLYGTMAGALFGGIGGWMRTRTPIPEAVILLAAILPCSLLAAAKPKFRLAPVTAGLVLLVFAHGGAPLRMAFIRVAEIAIGSVIGMLTALLVLPGRGAVALHQHGAAALDAMGELARSYLTDTASAEPFNRRIQAAIDRAQTTCAEAAREQAAHLAGGPPPEPLMRTLRRLRTDVALLGRAISVEPAGDEHGRLADTLLAWFRAAAHALRTASAPPDLGAVKDASVAVAPESALGFALLVLARDQEELRDRMAERATPHRPSG